MPGNNLTETLQRRLSEGGASEDTKTKMQKVKCCI